MTDKNQPLLPTWTELLDLVRSARNQVIITAIVASLTLLFKSVRSWLWGFIQRFSFIVDRFILVPYWVVLIVALVIILETVYITFCLRRKPSAGLRAIYYGLSEDERKTIRLLAQAGFGLSEGELSEKLNLSLQHFLWLIDQLTKKYKLVNRSEQPSGGAYWSLNEQGRAMAAELRLFAPQQPTSKDTGIDRA
jgi:DNA-binding MarR family transcriptional regulator